jgi:hypothetical protein
MRKNYKREINLLREDVERLEKKLDVKSDELYEQRKCIDFLLEHDRNDVVIHNVGGIVWGCSTYANDIEVEYISHIEIKRVRISMRLFNEANVIATEAKVIENEGEKIVIKTYNKDEPEYCHYYRIIKYSGEVADVTEYYQQTETDFKYFTAEQVRNMSQKEVKENYSDIMKSMEKW